MTWYAVCSGEAPSDPTVQVWTVTKDRQKPGWCTDSGCEGYGLTMPEAIFLATAANEKEARDGKYGPWEPNRVRSM